LSKKISIRFGLGSRCWSELLDLGDLGRRQASEQNRVTIKVSTEHQFADPVEAIKPWLCEAW